MQKLQNLIAAVEGENRWTGRELRAEDKRSSCFLSVKKGMHLLLDQSQQTPSICSFKSTHTW